MIDERLQSLRMVRDEADRLRLACIAVAGTATFLHIAHDRSVSRDLPATFMGLLQQMDAKPKRG